MILFTLIFITEISDPLIRQADSFFLLESFERAESVYVTVLNDCNREDSAWVRKGLGNLAFIHGRFDDALEQYEKGLTIFETIGGQRGMAKILNNLGQVYAMQADHEKALGCYARAIDLIDAVADPAREDTLDKIALLGNTGQVMQASYRIHDALEYYRAALLLAYTSFDDKAIADNCYNCAAAYQTIGEVDSALEYYTTAWTQDRADTVGWRLPRVAVSSGGTVAAQ